MQRQRQHVAALPIDVLGAVAVVHVPVEHRHLTEAIAGLGALDGDGNIGRSRSPSIDPAGSGGPAGVTAHRRYPARPAAPPPPPRRPARRRAWRFHSCPAPAAPLPQQAAAAVAHLFETLQIVGGVNAQQVFFRRRFGAQQGELARQAGHVHQVLHAPFGFRRLGVAGARRRLHPAADRQGGGVQAGAVPETAFIKQETGCSFTFLLLLYGAVRAVKPAKSTAVTAARSPARRTARR